MYRHEYSAGPDADGALLHARWLVESKRRWPISALVAHGAWLAVYAALAGAGREAARASLPSSQAAVLELAPAPVPEAENAAVIWRRAFETLAALREGDDGFGVESELRRLGSASEDKLTAEELARYEGILELAADAARLERCNWGVDYSSEPFPEPMDHLKPLRTIGYLCARRAELAGAAGDWQQVEADARIIIAAARHVQVDPVLICYLIGMAIDRTAVDAIHRALAAAAGPPAGTLERLQVTLRERLASLAPLARILQAERKINLRCFDLVGADELGGLAFGREIEMPGRMPLVFHYYGTIYPWDRAFYDEWMGRIVAESEARERGEEVLVPSGIEKTFRSGRLESRVALLSALVIFSQSLISEHSSNGLARMRSALAALAALERRLGPGGAWPESLDELGLSDDGRTDPWSRERGPLRHRELSDGSFAVWSVGEEGAKLEEAELLDRFEEGKVIGFRVQAPGGEDDEGGG